MLQSHKIESEHSDQDNEPTKQEAHPLSHKIGSELMNQEPPTDFKAVSNPASLPPLSCASDDHMETSGINIDQMEAENTQVEGQASDMFLPSDVMELISDYCKESNLELVAYSQSSGSASPIDTVSTDQILFDDDDNEQCNFKMSVTLK